MKNVGGAQNVADVTHCFTRLRFVLKNRELANKEIVEKLEGVIQVVEANGQFQVVIGTKVDKVYEAIYLWLIDEKGNEIKADKGSLGNRICRRNFKNFYSISSGNCCFGADQRTVVCCNSLGVDQRYDSTYILLNTASNIIFYYMPIFFSIYQCKKP